MIRRTRIKAKRSKPRRGPLRDPEYRKYLRTLQCAAYNRLTCYGEIDPAHTVNNGMGSKGSDASCVPLCRTHHREYDAGRAAFEEKYKLDMQTIAAAYYNWFKVWS